MAYTENLLGEQTLVMGNEQFIRKMAIGSNWQKVRIALRCCVTCDSTVPIVAAMGLGLTRGMRQQFAADADMVYWSYHALNAPQAWIASAQGLAYRQGYCAAYANLNGVTTQGIAGYDDYNNGVPWRGGFGSYPKRFIVHNDFWRQAGTIYVKSWCYGASYSNPTVTDKDQGIFYWDLESDLSPSTLNTTFQNSGTTSYTGSGELDSVWIRWTSTNPAYKLMISDIGVCRMS
jgi:hypothetical protein